MEFVPATTCALVRISPLSLMTMPVPAWVPWSVVSLMVTTEGLSLATIWVTSSALTVRASGDCAASAEAAVGV